MNCVEPGCPGTYQSDGWCDYGGHKAPADFDASAPPAPSLPSTPLVQSAASAPSAPSARSGGTTRTAVARTGRMGAGLVGIPPARVPDPASVVLSDPQIPEHERFCAVDGEPVGRGRDGRPARTAGFCPKCRTPFSFVPSLGAGDLVAGRYEVVGCLAHGGLGWIYLARARNVDNMWVALKGMRESGEAVALAQQELRFLATVDHPSIVKVLDFDSHEGEGYIVMEYVGGPSLRDLMRVRLEANGGAADPLPIEHALAFVVDILPALGYLHDEGLLYCDFKPDNVIQAGTALKLIDLGAVYRIDDRSSDIYGTVGYQAPEIARTGPTIESDTYTVGRSIAVMCTDFRGFQKDYVHALPTPDDVPQYREFDSLYRLVARATAEDPAQRFHSAEEMGDQVAGVLREVISVRTGTPTPGVSATFTGEIRGDLDAPDWRTLPVPLTDLDDDAAPYLASLTGLDADALLDALDRAPEQTPEVQLQRVRAFLDGGRVADAAQLVETLEQAGADWRAWWYRGIVELARNDTAPARATFGAIYRLLPGELAPKLALGLAAEAAGDEADAARWYEIVARTDPWFLTASFGLARCRRTAGDTTGAVAAYDQVPQTSAAYVDAQIAATRARLEAHDLASTLVAARTVDGLPLDPARRDGLAAEVMEVALDLVAANGSAPTGTVFGNELTEPGLRLGLERAYRSLAKRATTTDERIDFVDRANQVRPRTLT